MGLLRRAFPGYVKILGLHTCLITMAVAGASDA